MTSTATITAVNADGQPIDVAHLVVDVARLAGYLTHGRGRRADRPQALGHPPAGRGGTAHPCHVQRAAVRLRHRGRRAGLT